MDLISISVSRNLKVEEIVLSWTLPSRIWTPKLRIQIQSALPLARVQVGPRTSQVFQFLICEMGPLGLSAGQVAGRHKGMVVSTTQGVSYEV